MVWLTVKDLRWASAQIAADDIRPMLETDIRRAVKRWVRYRREVAARKALISSTALGLAQTQAAG